jgi:16S rRNA G1207 methylase RsmC
MDVKTCTWLMEESITVEADDRIAVLFADDPAFVYFLSQSVRQVDVFDYSHSSLTALNAEIGAVENITIHETVFPAAGSDYDHIFMLTFKGRDFDRALIWSAYHALSVDGSLYIAGSTREGAKTIIKDAGLVFQSINTLIYKRSHRVGEAIRLKDTDCDYPAKWGDYPPIAPHRLTLSTPQGKIDVATMPGVFSWQSLDKGTSYLLERFDMESHIQAGMRVLDMACGYGVLGTLAARYAGGATMVDDNLLAVRCAAMTAAYNDQNAIKVEKSDVFSALDDQQYDLILCNPPFHREFDVNTNVAHRVIREAPEHLNRDGMLVMICNAFLPYEQEFEQHFRYVSVIGDSNRYKIIQGRVS